MKRFISQAFLFGILILVLHGIGLILTPMDKDYYIYEYRHKVEMLDTVSSPRLIFVGGSNLAFGLESNLIEDSLKLNVINYGLHAGIGLKYMLDDIDKYLKRGDIVAIVPEYSHFYGCINGESPTLCEAFIANNYRSAIKLNFRQWINIICGTSKYLKAQVLFKINNNKDPRVYLSSNFNSKGDEIRHYEFERLENIKPIELNEMDEQAINYTAEVINSWKNREIHTILLPPTTIQSNYELNADKIDELYSYMQAIGHPFAVPACSHVVPDSCGYDTPYHLTKSGADIFTQSLIMEFKTLIPKVQRL